MQTSSGENLEEIEEELRSIGKGASVVTSEVAKSVLHRRVAKLERTPKDVGRGKRKHQHCKRASLEGRAA